MRTDGRSDWTKLIVPKNVSVSAVILQLKVLQQFLAFVFRIKAVKQHNRSGQSTVFGIF
jgi:hypothetical protein